MAHDPRRDLGEEPGGPDDANQIRDRKRDRNSIGHGNGVGARQAEPRDRVRRRSDRCRLGEVSPRSRLRQCPHRNQGAG